MENVKEIAKAAAVVMDAATIAEIAKDAAKDCATCKAVAAKFAGLVKSYGKENAVLIQAAAKDIVKASTAATKDAAKDARAALNNGAFVARAAWLALLNEDRSGAQFARIVYENENCNLERVVTKYASYYCVCSDEPKNTWRVALVKSTYTDEDGNKQEEYKPRNLATVGGYLAALKVALNNAKRAALGEPRAKWQREIAARDVVGLV